MPLLCDIINYIGADYNSQPDSDFDWYNPHLYQPTTEIIKLILVIVFKTSDIYISTN